MGDMGDIWHEVKKDSRSRKQNNLDNFNLDSWNKHNRYQFYKKIDNKVFTYYPSTKCLVFENKSYKGVGINKLEQKCLKLLNKKDLKCTIMKHRKNIEKKK